MNVRNQKSQSTVEFIIVLALIIATVLLAAQDVLKPAVVRLMNNLSDLIKRSTGNLI